MIDTELYEDEIVDDIIEDDIIEEDEVIEDEIDDSHNGIENREVLETKYNTYNKAYDEIVILLNSIIEKGELTQEDKDNMNSINDKYNDSYIELNREINIAKQIIDDNKWEEIKANMGSSSQEDVFNALTNNGAVQGLIMDDDGNIYLNAQFLQTRGFSVVNDDNKVTLSIDDNGNLTTSGDIVGGSITGATMNAMTINTNTVNIESEDGGMTLKGALQKFTDENGNVRILIGRDSDNKFKFTLFGENGQTVLIDENGIKSDAISSEIIEGTHIKGDTIEGTHIKGDTITGKHIQAGSITAGSGIIADGAIGSAQISELDAGKISAGTIDTSKVDIAGSNGNLLVRGNRLQVFEGHGNNKKERVSLGDVNNDGSVYGLRVRGKDGETVLFDENGITEEGITDGSITNDKISDDTKIAGYKLDINSVIREINGSTETISGTKININGTNLSTELSTIKDTQSEQANAISSNASKIEMNEHKIDLKVDSQEYIKDKENLENSIKKNTSAIKILEDEIDLTVKESIAKVSIGANNYIQNSGNFENNDYWLNARLENGVLVGDTGDIANTTNIEIEKDTEYIYSVTLELPVNFEMTESNLLSYILGGTKQWQV